MYQRPGSPVPWGPDLPSCCLLKTWKRERLSVCKMVRYMVRLARRLIGGTFTTTQSFPKYFAMWSQHLADPTPVGPCCWLHTYANLRFLPKTLLPPSTTTRRKLFCRFSRRRGISYGIFFFFWNKTQKRFEDKLIFILKYNTNVRYIYAAFRLNNDRRGQKSFEFRPSSGRVDNNPASASKYKSDTYIYIYIKGARIFIKFHDRTARFEIDAGYK